MRNTVKSYIEKNNWECEVYPSPFAVFLNKDEKIYVEPDISVICDKDKLDDRGWIVDPEKERTTIYYYEQDEAPMISLFTQTIQSGIYEGLEINISELLK